MDSSHKAIGLLAILIGVVWLVSGMPDAWAGQKGLGDSTGIAKRMGTLQVVTLSGEVLEIKIGPCETSTGKGGVGAHVLFRRPDGQTINLHLGPLSAVDHVIDQLSIGQSLSVRAFRTDQMPENAYVAKSLILDHKAIHLRDDHLRPSWAVPGAGGKQRGQGMGQRSGMPGPCR
jgi:hypothetical protein